MQDDLVLTKISLDEPSQLLSIIFDASSGWYNELIQHVPDKHKKYSPEILTQLYFDTVSQICIFINTFLSLNKRNLIHFIAVTDDKSIVLQQKLQYSITTPSATTIPPATTTTTTPSSPPTLSTQQDFLFPHATWVDPDRLPCPAQATDEMFGSAVSILYAKLLLLNPFQQPSVTQLAASLSLARPNQPQQNQLGDNSQTFGRIFIGAFTKALCFINKAKQFDQTLAPHILLFSLSPFQGSSGYMACALYASRINCLVDTLCLNHSFGHHDLKEEDFKDPLQKLSNLLSPLISTTLQHEQQQHNRSLHNRQHPNQPIPSSTTTTTTTTTAPPNPLQLLKKPQVVPSPGCHCESLQQASHITNGCSLYISHADFNTLIQLYSETYSPISLQQQALLKNQSGTNNGVVSNTMNDGSNALSLASLEPPSIQSLLFKPQDYLYLLPLLQTHCLSSESIRQHLITPIQTSVTLTAPCFCHPVMQRNSSNEGSAPNKSQATRYLCNVCLVVVCKPFPQCPNCKSRFVTSKPAILLKGAANNTNTQNGGATPTNAQPLSPLQPTQPTIRPQPPQQPPQQQQPTQPSLQRPPQQGAKPGKINISLGKR